MTVELRIIKTPSGWANADKEAEGLHRKTQLGAMISGKFSRTRNYKFHRKLFALLNLGFEYWEPGEVDSKHGIPVKNFDRFRKDCTILAGYYHNVIRLDGSVRVEADSISFAKMDQETFDNLYQAVLTVLLERIPMMAKMGEDGIEKVTTQILEFA